MGLGLFLWNQLPDQVPIHFGLNGQADNYAGKAFVVFGLPLLMAALQVLLLVVTIMLRKLVLTPRTAFHQRIGAVPPQGTRLPCIRLAASICSLLTRGNYIM